MKGGLCPFRLFILSTIQTTSSNRIIVEALWVESKGRDDHINHNGDLCGRFLCSKQTGVVIIRERVTRLWGKKKERKEQWPYQTCHVICGSLIPKRSQPSPLIPTHLHTHSPDTPDPHCHPKFQVRVRMVVRFKYGERVGWCLESEGHAHTWTHTHTPILPIYISS